ncbi:MAG: glycine--tRNA ligase [Candidatus Aenigmarchaeota archaeon]|nr:glycine--tRNA ligase [Candidatus Aenigmarchaeota archaeon]
MDIIELAKRRGFFWPSSLVYPPIAGLYDYGHIGTMVKRKWEAAWRAFFLGLDEYYYEISPAVIMPEQVFQASGHLEHFVDPVVRCTKCGHTERADHLVEGVLKEGFEGLPPAELDALIRQHKITCGKCKGALAEVGVLNMTFPLKAGTGAEARQAYLTPETAQGAYVNFRQMFDVARKRLPLGLAVVGKAFRNEIAPRNALVRMREFTQAELQIFFDPEKQDHPRFAEVAKHKLRILPAGGKEAQDAPCQELANRLFPFYAYHLAKIQEFFLEVLQIPRERFRFRELSPEERAFYNRLHWDIELDLPSLGWKEVGGLHYRGDHDLARHQEVSKEKMTITEDGRSFIPHVLEISLGVDRNLYALLDVCAQEEAGRAVIRFPRGFAPFDAAIFPLVNKDGLPDQAREIKQRLQQAGFSVFYDASGSIGRMYRRMDEIGGPACITVDHQTLQDRTVTLRDRDTMGQVRIPLQELAKALRSFLDGVALEKLGTPLAKSPSRREADDE